MGEVPGPSPEEVGIEGEGGVEEEWDSESLEDSLGMMGEILTDVIGNYTVEGLQTQPIRTEDVLMVMLSSGVDCPESWDDCNDATKDAIKSAMREAIQTLPGAKIEETDEGPEITA